MESKINYLWNIYGTVNQWINHADAKAGAILAAIGVFFGFIISNLKVIAGFISTSNWWLLFSCISIILLVAATCFALRGVMPRLKVDEPSSVIYFNHIAQFAHADYKERATSMLGGSNKMQSELIDQIWANSRVVQKKYFYVGYSIRFFIAAVAFSLIPTVFYLWTLL